MDGTAITTLIGTVGFPIVMCLLMFKQLRDSDTKHSEEISKMSEAINNNTIAITKLVDALDDRKE